MRKIASLLAVFFALALMFSATSGGATDWREEELAYVEHAPILINGNEATQELTFEVSVATDDDGADEGEKSFIESYGLPLGIAVAVAIITSALILVLRRQKGE